jgi:hypothetical protein
MDSSTVTEELKYGYEECFWRFGTTHRGRFDNGLWRPAR